MGAREVFLGLPDETLQGRQRLVKGRTVTSLSSQAVRMGTSWPHVQGPALHSLETQTGKDSSESQTSWL